MKFTIDRTPPTISLTALDPHAGTSGGPMVLDRPGRLRAVTRDALSGVQSVDYSLDGRLWTGYSDDVRFDRTLVVANPGPHRISIRAVDMAGNRAELDDQQLTVLDQAAPSPSPGASPTPRLSPGSKPAPSPSR